MVYLISNQEVKFLKKIIIFNLMSIITISIIIIILFFIVILINIKIKFNQNKSVPFEYRLNPFHKTQIPFSLDFYLIAIIILIFDIEISIILPTNLNN